MGNGIKSIGTNAFYGCISLTSMVIPKSVTSIGYEAFSECHKLVEVYNLSELNVAQYFSHEKIIHTSIDEESIIFTDNDYMFMVHGGKCYLIGYIGNDTELILPTSFRDEEYSIYNYAFYSQKNITKVIIQEGATSVGSYAFCECTALEDIFIPSSVTSVYIGAFRNCTSLSSVDISDSVTNMGNSVFYGCSSLSTVSLPVNLESVGGYMFMNCTALENIIIPGNVSAIGVKAFDGCSMLSYVSFENQVGWYTSKDIYSEEGTDISVTNPTDNAKNLRDTYKARAWKRG